MHFLCGRPFDICISCVDAHSTYALGYASRDRGRRHALCAASERVHGAAGDTNVGGAVAFGGEVVYFGDPLAANSGHGALPGRVYIRVSEVRFGLVCLNVICPPPPPHTHTHTPFDMHETCGVAGVTRTQVVCYPGRSRSGSGRFGLPTCVDNGPTAPACTPPGPTPLGPTGTVVRLGGGGARGLSAGTVVAAVVAAVCAASGAAACLRHRSRAWCARRAPVRPAPGAAYVLPPLLPVRLYGAPHPTVAGGGGEVGCGAGAGADAQTTCVICISSFGPGDRLTDLPCGHSFHEGCIDRWLAASAPRPGRCPLCKRGVADGVRASVELAPRGGGV